MLGVRSFVHCPFFPTVLPFFPLSLSPLPPFPSCSSWGRPDSSIKPINPRQPMAARCSHWDPSIDHSVSLCSLSLSLSTVGRPFSLAFPSTGSLLFAYQLRPPNLFNERLINVKAHRQKGHCRRPDFPLSLSLSRLRKLLLLVRLLVTRTRKRRKVGRVVGIIAIGFAEARALLSLLSFR